METEPDGRGDSGEQVSCSGSDVFSALPLHRPRKDSERVWAINTAVTECHAGREVAAGSACLCMSVIRNGTPPRMRLGQWPPLPGSCSTFPWLQSSWRVRNLPFGAVKERQSAEYVSDVRCRRRKCTWTDDSKMSGGYP